MDASSSNGDFPIFNCCKILEASNSYWCCSEQIFLHQINKPLGTDLSVFWVSRVEVKVLFINCRFVVDLGKKLVVVGFVHNSI